MTENFEGVFPSGSWQVDDNPTWASDDFNPYSGSKSAWCARGGSSGLDPATNNYPNNMNAWMIQEEIICGERVLHIFMKEMEMVIGTRFKK